jgi:hypothetical protein
VGADAILLAHMRIAQNPDGRHTITDVSPGELAAMLNLFSAAKRAGLAPTELQVEIFGALGLHLAGKTPAERAPSANPAA